MSIFSVKNYAEEFLSALDKDFKKNVEQLLIEDESIAATAEDISENTKDFILKELRRQLKGYDLEEFTKDNLTNLLKSVKEALAAKTLKTQEEPSKGIKL